MRNAVILLAAVALLLAAIGAANHSLTFDIEYGFGALRSVSLFWITLVTAGVVLVTGLIAAWLARSSAVAGQRKLERELQSTYERLRAVQAELLLADSAEPSQPPPGGPHAAPLPAAEAAPEPLPTAEPETVTSSVEPAPMTLPAEPQTVSIPAETRTVALPPAEPDTLSLPREYGPDSPVRDDPHPAEHDGAESATRDESDSDSREGSPPPVPPA